MPFQNTSFLLPLAVIFMEVWEMNRERLLEKIDGMNDRLKKLKLQGESSNTKTFKNVKKRRNLAIKELVKELSPEIIFSDLMNEVKDETNK